jgi:hypothetical protein
VIPLHIPGSQEEKHHFGSVGAAVSGDAILALKNSLA